MTTDEGKQPKLNVTLNKWRNWSSCTKLALSASWTHGLMAQSVRASGRNSVVVGSNATQANFLSYFKESVCDEYCNPSMMEAECQKIIIIWLIYQGIFASFGNVFCRMFHLDFTKNIHENSVGKFFWVCSYHLSCIKEIHIISGHKQPSAHLTEARWT